MVLTGRGVRLEYLQSRNCSYSAGWEAENPRGPHEHNCTTSQKSSIEDSH